MKVILFDYLVPTCYSINYVSVCTRRLLIGLDAVVAAHGWKGALSYRTARNLLHGCDWDDKEEEIYMSFPNLHDGVRLVIDFDKDDVDMKVSLISLCFRNCYLLSCFPLCVDHCLFNHTNSGTNIVCFYVYIYMLYIVALLDGSFLFSNMF